jgi:hypothetical protein
MPERPPAIEIGDLRDGCSFGTVCSGSTAMRVTVDFNYGGVQGTTGVVYLSPKSGDRSGFAPHIEAQFENAEVTPAVGMAVRLVDPKNDLDDEGRVCDLEADGTLEWIDDGHGWRAVYRIDSIARIPSENE